MRLAILQALARALWPLSCAFCGSRTGDLVVCAGCRADLPQPAARCPGCAVPLASRLPDGVPCVACQRHPPPWSECIVPFTYAWPVDAAIKAFKFHHRLVFGAAFAELLLPLVVGVRPAPAVLVPVPMHRRRHAARGFNQARELARALAAASGVPLLDAVSRVRPTRPQSGLGRAARRGNLGGAFRMRRPVAGRRVLLVDDIVTTGETCRHITELLLSQDARDVRVLAVARAVAGPQAGTTGSNV